MTEAWENLGFHILNDESTVVKVKDMDVQIIGVDYRDYDDKTESIMNDVFSKITFRDDVALRIVLLHDPTSFKCKKRSKNIHFKPFKPFKPFKSFKNILSSYFYLLNHLLF